MVVNAWFVVIKMELINERRVIDVLKNEADFLYNNLSNCLDRYVYVPVVEAMREGAETIEKLLCEMQG